MSLPTSPAPATPAGAPATVPTQSRSLEPPLSSGPQPIVPLPFSEPYVLATIRATQPISAPRLQPDPARGHATRGYAARHAAPPRAGAGSAPGSTSHLPDQRPLRDHRDHREQIPHQFPPDVRSPNHLPPDVRGANQFQADVRGANQLPAYRPPARPAFGAAGPPDQPRPPLFTMTPEPAPTKQRWILGAAALAIVLVAVCIGAVLVVGFGAKSVSDTIHNDEVAAGNDIAITGCEISKSTHRMVADVTITNRGRDAASYVVDVGFANAGGTEQFDAGVATADGLPAGRTITVFATAASTPPAAFTCTVTGATRF